MVKNFLIRARFAIRREAAAARSIFNKMLPYLLIVVQLIIVFGVGSKYGWKGVIICYALLGLFIVWRSWDMIKATQDHIACLIWGKPLRKEFWDKGERPAWPKIKLRGGKLGNNKHNKRN